ncbi:uncharacterized protein LOC100842179 [Brachypodium distachyon]|uniref:uncharacterized protein LOC100842179 n=1 Tax=Brachypodium distachyon TaxID=15368 RepID=UPI00071C77E6|nr:uncharacterized protein LOC100842179 [Brachypodium distachyon]|eukprot:XP_014756035.1 uncharacterized protein LOC100842179 [Brachypodium distachyon]
MGVRRFVNLLALNRARCNHSLHRFDLSRNQFFYATQEEVASHGRLLPMQKQAAVRPSCLKSPLQQKDKARGKKKKKQQQLAAKDIGTIRLPAPMFNMRQAPGPTGMPGQLKVDAFALSETNIMLADHHRRVLGYDASSHCAVTMPSLHAPKVDPLALSIPGEGSEGSIYIIERILCPETQRSFQFEALFSGGHPSRCGYYPLDTWQCQALPLPQISSERALVCSAAAVGNVICISVSGFGTYCFDRGSHSWSHAGDWMMPFFGTAEYDPDLNLWFGISDRDYYLPCAADLSPVARGQPPEPGLFWGHDDHLPEEWYYSLGRPSQILRLGSGRSYAVFTGLEVLPSKGKHGIRVVSHKYRRCRNPDTNPIRRLL